MTRFNLATIVLLRKSLSSIDVPPAEGDADTGTVVGGTFAATKRCEEEATWDIEEIAGGISITFSFSVQGKSRRVKVKGKSSQNRDYDVQAYNGIGWDTIDSLSITTIDNVYYVNLGAEYTIDGVTQVRVYRGAGTNVILYLDCVSVTAEETTSDVALYWPSNYWTANYWMENYWL
jgi:hypothetical protein